MKSSDNKVADPSKAQMEDLDVEDITSFLIDDEDMEDYSIFVKAMTLNRRKSQEVKEVNAQHQ